MAVRGVIDLQAKYNGTTCHIDGLVLEGNLDAPLISWHDLAQLKICNLPVTDVCNFCSESSKNLKDDPIKKNQISNTEQVKFDSDCTAEKVIKKCNVQQKESMNAGEGGKLSSPTSIVLSSEKDSLDQVKFDFKDVLNDEHMNSPMRAPPVSFVFKKDC